MRVGVALDWTPSRPLPASVKSDAGELARLLRIERASGRCGPETADDQGVEAVEYHTADLDRHRTSYAQHPDFRPESILHG